MLCKDKDDTRFLRNNAKEKNSNIFKILKKNNKTCQPKISYLSKKSFKNKGEIKTFTLNFNLSILSFTICIYLYLKIPLFTITKLILPVINMMYINFLVSICLEHVFPLLISASMPF